VYLTIDNFLANDILNLSFLLNQLPLLPPVQAFRRHPI
jgi:hypothetical protein